MRSTARWLIAFVLVCSIFLLLKTRIGRDTVAAQTPKPIVITRLYAGSDGLTHAEDIPLKLSGDRLNEVSEMLKVNGAEIHRTPPGKVNSWHTAPRRQYVITLSGRGEIELAGGKKISLEPGHIELAEDLTGKGHITRVVGNEDRVTIQLPLADQSGR
jgi:hypothetical protein